MFGTRSFSILGRNPRLGRGPLGSTPLNRTTLEQEQQLRIAQHYNVPTEKVIRVLGIDFGQMHDPAAAAVIRVRECAEDLVGPRYPFWDVSYLRTWDVGKYCYEEIIDDALCLNPDYFCFDYGGVGRGLITEIRRRAQEIRYRGMIVPIQAVGSNANMRMMSNPQGHYLIAPKIEIVSVLNMLQQQKKIRLPRAPETERLKAEMKDFKLLYTKAANLTFDQRGKNHHGDLVIALGQAAWFLWQPRRHLALNTDH